MIWVIGKATSELRAHLDAGRVDYGILHDAARKMPPTSAPVISVDFTDESSLLASVSHMDEAPSGFVIDGYEQYVEHLAWLNKRFAIPGLTVSGAINARNKIAMRRAFDAYDPQLSPAWQSVRNEQDLAAFMTTTSYPVMLKPVGLSKSRFVTKNDNWESLLENYQKLSSLAVPSAECIIEAFLDGSMHTVAGFATRDGEVLLLDEIIDCTTAAENGVADSYIAERSSPSRLLDDTADSLRAVARQAVTALGLHGVGLHIEIMLTNQGPKIIEIAARLGGYRPRMYKESFGINLFDGLVAIAEDRRLTLTPSKQTYSSVIEIFPTTTGLLKTIRNVSALTAMAGVQQVHQKVVAGEVCGRAIDGYRAAAIVFIADDDAAVVSAARQYAYEHVTAVV